MNEKQGEHLDQRIRQSLASLPEGPPPGSSFDSAQLWEQLRPELTVQPVAVKKRIGGWWLAAASVVGLLVGLWWSQQPSPESMVIKQSPARHTAKSGLAAKPEPALAKSPALVQRDDRLVVDSKSQKIRRLKPVESTKETQTTGSEIATQSTTNPAPEIRSLIPEPASLTSVVTTTKPTVAIITKRRFRVVHENELMAEDEAHRVRYANEARTERFVRLGTGSRTMTDPDQDSPGLMLPLNRKSTQ